MRKEVAVVKDTDGVAEARLIEVYKLIAQAHNREALIKADALVADYPHFQLAQLVLGDLLAAKTRPIKAFGDVSDTVARNAGAALAELREESRQRVRALRERPVHGTVPSQFLALSQKPAMRLRWMRLDRGCTCLRTPQRTELGGGLLYLGRQGGHCQGCRG